MPTYLDYVRQTIARARDEGQWHAAQGDVGEPDGTIPHGLLKVEKPAMDFHRLERKIRGKKCHPAKSDLTQLASHANSG